MCVCVYVRVCEYLDRCICIQKYLSSSASRCLSHSSLSDTVRLYMYVYAYMHTYKCMYVYAVYTCFGVLVYVNAEL